MTIASFAVLVSVNSPADETQEASSSYGPFDIHYRTGHLPIYIDGDGGFNSSNGVTGGNGTESNPYIIEEWSINSTTTHGIHLLNTNKHVVIRWCYITTGYLSGSSGIYVEFCSNVTVTDNECAYDSMGIFMACCSDSIISWNSCHNNSEGIFVELCADNVTIERNEVFGNDYGIHNNDAWNTFILNNRIHNNAQCGIIMTVGSVTVTVRNNIIQSNGKGISVNLDSYWIPTNGISIYNNNLIGNSVQATDNNIGHTRWNGTGSGNYWSSWTSPDADLNGIVDNPYTNISAGAGKDWYPLTKPVKFSPICTITSPTTEPSYNTTSPTIMVAGIASDDLGVVALEVGNPLIGYHTTIINLPDDPYITNWSDIRSLSPGLNQIWVYAYDGEGTYGFDAINVTYTPTVSCTITSPTSLSEYYTNWGWIKLGGVAVSDAGVTSVTWSNLNGSSGTAYGTTSWQSRGNVQLFPGSNYITATAQDANGSITTDQIEVIYDTTPPTCTITTPTSSPTYSTNLTMINLEGSASDANGIASVTWKNKGTGASGYANLTGWRINSIVLNAGMNLIYVNATDRAGNKNSDAIWIASDQGGPAVSITNPTANPTMTTGWHMIYLRGTATDDNKVTMVTWTNSLGGSGTAYMTPQWGGASVTWQSRGNIHLLPGDNVITVTAYDNAGNTNTDVLTVTYTGL
jgi:parallel beta-helix repeat protein